MSAVDGITPKAVRRSLTGPYGHVYRGRSDLALVRVFKAGSTNFSTTFGLKKWVPFSDARDLNIYCCLRDPFDRFISSVPETLSRYGSILSKKDVKVDIRICEALDALLPSAATLSAEKFINAYLDLIDHFGFFDAHHEPQFYYLLGADEAGLSIRYFALADMDRVVAELARSYRTRRAVRYDMLSKLRKTDPNVAALITGIRDTKAQGGWSVSLRSRLHGLYAQDHALLREKLGG